VPACPLNLANIEKAAQLIDPVFLHSPQYEDGTLNSALSRPFDHRHTVCGSACRRFCQRPSMAPTDHIQTLKGSAGRFDHVVTERQAVGGD
jgi:hypothetical protein